VIAAWYFDLPAGGVSSSGRQDSGAWSVCSVVAQRKLHGEELRLILLLLLLLLLMRLLLQPRRFINLCHKNSLAYINTNVAALCWAMLGDICKEIRVLLLAVTVRNPIAVFLQIIDRLYLTITTVEK